MDEIFNRYYNGKSATIMKRKKTVPFVALPMRSAFNFIDSNFPLNNTNRGRDSTHTYSSKMAREKQ